VRNWLFRDQRVRNGPTVRQFWGEDQVAEQEPLRIVRRSKRMLDNVSASRQHAVNSSQRLQP
jgi:hypothetical protein